MYEKERKKTKTSTKNSTNSSTNTSFKNVTELENYCRTNTTMFSVRETKTKKGKKYAKNSKSKKNKKSIKNKNGNSNPNPNSVQQGLTLITIQLAKKIKQPSWTRWSTTISSESGLTSTAIDNETKTTDTHVNDRRGPPINILDALKQAETEKDDEDDEQDGDDDNTEDDMFTKYPKRYEMAKTICKFLKLSVFNLKNNNLLLITRIILIFVFTLYHLFLFYS